MDRLPQLAWPVPASFPDLSAGHVHVWSAWLDDPQAAGPDTLAGLSDEERVRAAAFYFDADRRRYVAAHAILRGLLGRYLGVNPATLDFSKGPAGKPRLAGDSGLEFNLAHSGPVGLLAVTRGQQVGVDVELLWEMPDLNLLEARMFTAGALRRQQGLASGPRLRGFYRRWTQLEAVGKCRGIGVDLDHTDPGPEHLSPADPAEGFTACLACERSPDRVEFVQFTPKVLAPSKTTALTRSILPPSPHRQVVLAPLSSA